MAIEADLKFPAEVSYRKGTSPGVPTPVDDQTNGLPVTILGSGGSANLGVNLTQVLGTAVGAANPVPASTIVNGAVVSASNPEPITGAVAKLSTSLDWKYAALTGGITDTSDVVLKAAAGVNLINTLDSLQFVNKATAVSTEVVVKDGSTVIWRGWAPASVAAVTQLQMTPVTFDPPLQSSANTALNFACITTSSATYVNAQGSVVA